MKDDESGVGVIGDGSHAENLFHNANNLLRCGCEIIGGCTESHRLADQRNLSNWSVVLVAGFE